MANFDAYVPNVMQSLMGGEQSFKDARANRLQNDTMAARQEAAQIMQGGGDPRSAIARLLGAGDVQGASTIANMGNNERDFAFRQQEAQRSQGNSDRQFGLQQKQAEEKPSYQTIEAPDGTKQLVQIDPYGRGAKVVNPTGAPQAVGNPFAYGKQNETQSKDSGYANRMFRAEGVLREPGVEKAATSAWENIKGMAPGMTSNYITSPDYQKFDQAKRDFVNAVLRRESGAAISQSEFDNAHKQYFPQPGDSSERIAEKRKNRQDAIAGVAGGGGQAYRPPATFDVQGNMVPTGNPKQGVARQSVAPPSVAIEALKANPALKEQFEQKYGAGSAAQVLGGP